MDWSSITGILALANLAIVAATVVCVLTIKREPTAAIAWCLLVIVIPILGVLLFVVFGYQSVHAPLRKKKEHAEAFLARTAPEQPTAETGYEGLAALAHQLGARDMVGGNRVELFHDGKSAYESMLEAIRGAQHHIHMEFFIARADVSGEQFMRVLAEKSSQGVEVRFLYDALGSWKLHSRVIRILTRAGGKALPFLPLLNPLRRRIQINLRNHRKILVIDGRIGYTGGLNLGDEYLGKDPFFGPWRDTFVRVEGPAASGFQRIFVQDWDFACDEDLTRFAYFPRIPDIGDAKVQVAWSGPDQDIKTIREVYFAAIMRARQRVWLATPYFVPDAGLFDALCLAARSGRDVRVLCPFRPDKWIPHLAGRFVWGDLLKAGVRVYQYTAGFMHAKLLIIDGHWASVGTPNFDNRSLLLNFEATCLIESDEAIKNLEAAFQRDLERSIQVNYATFHNRPFVAKMAENVCRLMSPVL